MNEVTDEPTWRCHQNPFIGALGIQEPVIPGEPLINKLKWIKKKFPYVGHSLSGFSKQTIIMKKKEDIQREFRSFVDYKILDY